MASKLHPIYIALDSHQYSRAIKAASALPESNVLGKALLAHAYFKGGQKYNALVTLRRILDNQNAADSFLELTQEVTYALETRQLQEQQSQQQQQNQQQQQQSNSSGASRKGKKGKRKPVSTPKQPTTSNTPSTSLGPEKVFDLVTQLDTPPDLPDNWETLPPSEYAITDETTLATLAVTLQHLKLFVTAYQLYAWAVSAEPNEVVLTKTFSCGLLVLSSPRKTSLDTHMKVWKQVLSNLQAVALQLARLSAAAASHSTIPSHKQQQEGHFLLTTAWASQTALWQLQWLPPDSQRSAILPRLAESMAERLLKVQTPISSEDHILYLKTLEYQSKWDKMLEVLEQIPLSEQENPADPEQTMITLTPRQVMKEKARVLQELGHFEAAVAVYDKLLNESPDDWSFWQGYLTCSTHNDNVVSGLEQTEATIDRIITGLNTTNKYPLRGPYLMKVQLAAYPIQQKVKKEDNSSITEDEINTLVEKIKVYANLFSGRASCTFSDLNAFIELVLSHGTAATVESLLDWAQNQRLSNVHVDQQDTKERKSRLRIFIMATKLTHKLVSPNLELQSKWLPDWKDLLNEWKNSLSLSPSNEGEPTQRDIRPGDDLVLLAVQQIICGQDTTDSDWMLAASILEAAIQSSPDNAYLKMSAIRIYHELNAMPRAMELFRAIGLKHIQYDSCTFIILPYLNAGGLYDETIEICNTLLRFHTNTARECGDFAGKAMESGTLSKANEFIVFQCEKMNASLALMQAKGLILDSAPLMVEAAPKRKNEDELVLQGRLGLRGGIVGDENDMGRAEQMVTESHNPYAALSIVPWASLEGGDGTFSDNRDFAILSYELLKPRSLENKDEMIRVALRRGYIHGLLIRTTLCLDVVKGPKKGKIVKTSEELEKRSSSLLDTIKSVETFLDNQCNNKEEEKSFLQTLITLCRLVPLITAGLPLLENDSLETREKEAIELLSTATLQQKQVRTILNLSLPKAKNDPTFVALVCTILPNYIVPIMATFRMCAKIFVTFGWGKRKRKTKPVVAALAEFAIEYSLLLGEMLSCLDSLPEQPTMPITLVDPKLCVDWIEEKVIQETIACVSLSQYKTRWRVEPVLQEMKELLDSFDVVDD